MLDVIYQSECMLYIQYQRLIGVRSGLGSDCISRGMLRLHFQCGTWALSDIVLAEYRIRASAGMVSGVSRTLAGQFCDRRPQRQGGTGGTKVRNGVVESLPTESAGAMAPQRFCGAWRHEPPR